MLAFADDPRAPHQHLSQGTSPMSTSADVIPSHRAFLSDNMAGASPEIAQAVAAAAAGYALSYGSDPFTGSVRRRLSEIFERDVDVFPVSTGTAANCLGLAALTPPWGSVLCHPNSHINIDECGAPEFFTGGAKLVTVPGDDSKIDPDALREAVCRKAGDVHSVQPSVVSISQATESGSVYTLDEIRRLATIAKDAGLRVHMDGARFANALDRLGAAPAEMTWKAGIDVLSFGATKNGAMTADVIVSFDPALATELAFRAKRAGQLASKMRFHAAQLDAYLTDDLWLRNARQANTMAARLGDGLKAIPGTELLSSPQANILFCRLHQQTTEGLLAEGYTFYHDRWAPGIVRLVTSFSHTPEDIDQLLDAVRRHTR
jgi:threonine aldolase